MKPHTVPVAILGILVAVPATAQEILKSEPPRGGLRTGQAVLVDNGRCPKGQIMRVSGGYFAGRRSGTSGGGDRQRECVPRP